MTNQHVFDLVQCPAQTPSGEHADPRVSTGNESASGQDAVKPVAQSVTSVDAALEGGSEAHDAQQHEQLMQLLESEQVVNGGPLCDVWSHMKCMVVKVVAE